MSNILISLGSVIREKGLLNNLNQINDKTFFLVEQKHKHLYKNLLDKQKIYFERNLLKNKKIKLSNSISLKKIYKITDEILKDQNSQFILSRRKLSYYEYSPMRLKDIAISLINHSINIILKYKLNYFIIHNTPHSEDWFLFRTAELMGKKIFIIRESLIPGYSRFHMGLKDQTLINWRGDNHKINKNILNKFIKEKSKQLYNYPKLQEDRKKMYGDGYSGLISETRFFLKEDSFNLKRTIKAKLAVIKSSIFKNDSLNFYQSNISIKNGFDLIKYSPYIIYFLHYQPERTSIPEANDFSYQYKTILYLRKSIPKNINLLIKEHPDAYRNKFSPRFKSRESYINLLNIPGIYFCSMNIDPFTILDNSLLISTLTGNVGIESICRGKKVIYFGNPIYKDYAYALNGSDKRFGYQIKKILSKDEIIDKKYISEYIHNYFIYSYKNNFDNFSTNLLNHLVKNINKL